MNNTRGSALFVGRAYIDFTVITDHMPTGDEKAVAKAHAVSVGGNAVAAAFCCAKLGLPPHLLCTVADDDLGMLLQHKVSKYGIQLHPREVPESAFSFIRPHKGERAILRARDEEYLHAFPVLEIDEFGALHLDGHQPDAAMHYAQACRDRGILTSLDGGSLRTNTRELLEFIDVAVVSVRLCKQMSFSPAEMLHYLRSKGCKVGAVTLGEFGVVWYDKKNITHSMPAISLLREKIIDTNGAGDVFHGAYVYSYLRAPEKEWEEHFHFSSVAAAHSIQYLGIEAGLPTLANIEAAMSSRPVAVGQ